MFYRWLYKLSLLVSGTFLTWQISTPVMSESGLQLSTTLEMHHLSRHVSVWGQAPKGIRVRERLMVEWLLGTVRSM